MNPYYHTGGYYQQYIGDPMTKTTTRTTTTTTDSLDFLPGTTETTTYITGGTGNFWGPNPHQIPAHYPILVAEPSCGRCQGLGYKQRKLGRGWRPCHTCASRFGTNLSVY